MKLKDVSNSYHCFLSHDMIRHNIVQISNWLLLPTHFLGFFKVGIFVAYYMIAGKIISKGRYHALKKTEQDWKKNRLRTKIFSDSLRYHMANEW